MNSWLLFDFLYVPALYKLFPLHFGNQIYEPLEAEMPHGQDRLFPTLIGAPRWPGELPGPFRAEPPIAGTDPVGHHNTVVLILFVGVGRLVKPGRPFCELFWSRLN